jgi:hypothetical protein
MGKSSKNTCQHTRSIQRDRQQHQVCAPPDEVLESRLEELLHPATLGQVAEFQRRGLRERTLTLPVMMAVLTSLIWRSLGSIAEVTRVLSSEGLLWSEALSVRQQSLNERLRSLPADLFEAIFQEVLPQLHQRWEGRTRRLKPVLAWASEAFSAVVVADASTLDAVLKKLALLRSAPNTPLAGKMLAVLDLLSRQARAVYFEPDAAMSEQRFWDRLMSGLREQTLLLVDMGFSNYVRFAELTNKSIWMITRAKSDTSFSVLSVLEDNNQVRDRIIRLGRGKHRCSEPMRLVEVYFHRTWYRYLTNLLDADRLPAITLAALYRERWTIERVFLTIKRLLGLAYFYNGSTNAIALQLWTTWMLYGVLIDLADELGQQLELPLEDLSLEMLYRGVYHYIQARYKGTANDPITYFADNAQRLGIIKQKRRHKPKRIPLLTRLAEA